MYVPAWHGCRLLLCRLADLWQPCSCPPHHLLYLHTRKCLDTNTLTKLTCMSDHFLDSGAIVSTQRQRCRCLGTLGAGGQHQYWNDQLARTSPRQCCTTVLQHWPDSSSRMALRRQRSEGPPWHRCARSCSASACHRGLCAAHLLLLQSMIPSAY